MSPPASWSSSKKHGHSGGRHPALWGCKYGNKQVEGPNSGNCWVLRKEQLNEHLSESLTNMTLSIMRGFLNEVRTGEVVTIHNMIHIMIHNMAQFNIIIFCLPESEKNVHYHHTFTIPVSISQLLMSTSMWNSFILEYWPSLSVCLSVCHTGRRPSRRSKSKQCTLLML